MSIFHFKARDDDRGFTLTEILVVIAVIALLSAILLATLGIARKKSRDAKRIEDIASLHRAIESYVSDHGGVAPPQATWNTDLTAQGYIPSIPADPSGGSAAYGYQQLSGGSYVLGAIMENTGQAMPLDKDWDGNQAVTINGAAHNCNENKTGSMQQASEVVYCVYWP